MSSAETFTSAELLERSKENLEGYIGVSIGMTGLVAARNDKEHGDCIDRWYFKKVDERNAHIIEMMRQHPNYHPQAVILAVLRKACGPFDYSKR